MKIEKFEDLKVWKESMRLSASIYKQFKTLKDYGFRDQIQRASVSVPSNIAEGYDRNSNKEFIQYLYISKGSAGELRTQLYLSIELKLITKVKGLELLEQSKKVSAMLYNLIKIRKEKF
jgi:four helix bundle protein